MERSCDTLRVKHSFLRIADTQEVARLPFPNGLNSFVRMPITEAAAVAFTVTKITLSDEKRPIEITPNLSTDKCPMEVLL